MNPHKWFVKNALMIGSSLITLGMMSPFGLVQGTQPRVAIEGYLSGSLIGSVVLDVLVPNAAFFDGRLRVYLPIVLRNH